MTVEFFIPGAPVGKVKTAIDRMIAKLALDGECWAWTGVTDRKGYARFRGPDYRRVFVHRFAYEMAVGPIPDGLTIDHLCRNRSCCNPAHLEPVTMAENIRRGTQGQFQRRKTHCPSGHPYDEENTYVPPSGERQCRTCKREAGRRHDKRRGGRRGR